MELRPITNAVTKTLVIVIFWVVLLIDLILEPTISFMVIIVALIKAVVISGVFWLLFVLLVDTFLKTILLDAKEKKADRTDGGLSYHITEPDAEELAWLRAEEKEKAMAKAREKEEKEREMERLQQARNEKEKG